MNNTKTYQLLRNDLKKFLSPFFNLMNEFDHLSMMISDHEFEKIALTDDELSNINLRLNDIESEMIKTYFNGDKNSWKEFSREACMPSHFENYENFWISDFKRANGEVCLKIWKQRNKFDFSPMAFTVRCMADGFFVRKWDYNTSISMMKGDLEFPKPEILHDEYTPNSSKSVLQMIRNAFNGFLGLHRKNHE